MNSSRQLILLTVSALALTLTACKPDPAIQKGEVVDAGVKPVTAPPPGEPQTPNDEIPAAPSPIEGPTGSVAGTITFLGKAPGGTINTDMDPACSFGSSGKLPVEQFAVKNGKLANVFLYVVSGPPEAMQAGTISNAPVVLDQQRCQYVPHVIAVQAGGTVEFRNSDPTMHNIHTMPSPDAGNQTIDISQSPRGPAQTKQFAKPETMIPVRCNNHPWMNAFINVSATPFFAVSDATGHYEIHGLPPGDYVLGAAQEKMGQKTIKVTIQPDMTAHANLSFSAS